MDVPSSKQILECGSKRGECSLSRSNCILWKTVGPHKM
jgi:hypothetical protein